MNTKIFFLSFLLRIAISFGMSCLNSTNQVHCCKKFDEYIWQLGVSPPECCDYPKIVTPHFNPCFRECITNSTIEMNLRCCIVSCCFKKLGIIEYPEVNAEIKKDGLKLSFMLSVKKFKIYKAVKI